MNCYVCRVETGNELRPALAICQRCGAGVCGAHLREWLVTPIVGLAGDTRSILVCCRCFPSILPSTRWPESRKYAKEQGKQNWTWRWNWWSWLRLRRASGLPEPEEAVTAVEHFLHRQQSE